MKNLVACVLVSLMSTACADDTPERAIVPDPEPTTAAPRAFDADFAAAPAAMRSQAIAMALGLEAAQATFVAVEAMSDAWRDAPEGMGRITVATPSGCPQLSPIAGLSENETWRGTLSVSDDAGCVGHRSGAVWAGRIDGAVPFSLMTGRDPQDPIDLKFTGWSRRVGSSDERWDGYITGDRGQPSTDAPMTIESALTLSVGGDIRSVEMTTRATLLADGGVASALLPGAHANLPGLGTFGMSVEVVNHPDGTVSGVVTLTGRNTLVVDLNDRDDKGCSAATVDGAPVERLCREGKAPPEPEVDRVASVTLMAATCDGGRHDVRLGLDGPAESVSLYLGPNPFGDTEWHPLTRAPDSEREWSVSLEVVESANISAGSHSAVSCGADREPARLVEVRSPAGVTVACFGRGDLPADLVATVCPEGVLPLP